MTYAFPFNYLLPLESGCTKAECDQLNGGIDHVTDKDTGCHNFRIGTLLLIQVPCTTNAQEVTAITSAI